MAIHGIQEARAVTAGAATVQAVIVLSGVWYIHSISIQNTAAAEAATIGMQMGTDVYDPARTMHPLAVGTSAVGVPMAWDNGFKVKGQCLIYGEVVHAGASTHTLTVLAWKVKDR